MSVVANDNSRSRRRSFQPGRVLAAFLLIGCGHAADQIPPHQSPEKNKPLRLSRTDNGYLVTLLFREKRGLISFELAPQEKSPTPAPPMATRVVLWKPLIEEFLRERGRKPSYLLAVGQYPELSSRLASAAACSGNWNFKTGKPHRGNPNVAIQQLINANHLTPEIDSLFSSAGYRVSVDSVEQVMLCHGADLQPDPAASCHPKKFERDAQLPCGASIVFRLNDASR
jgi:hypothetical protein